MVSKNTGKGSYRCVVYFRHPQTGVENSIATKAYQDPATARGQATQIAKWGANKNNHWFKTETQEAEWHVISTKT